MYVRTLFGINLKIKLSISEVNTVYTLEYAEMQEKRSRQFKKTIKHADCIEKIHTIQTYIDE